MIAKGANMGFRMSTNISVRTDQFEEAVRFYSEVIGFDVRKQGDTTADLDANPLTLFIDRDLELKGPVMELFVDDIEQAREMLEANGCKVLRWKGKGQDCYIQDPYGVRFNIWEE
jgi:predicted enzyme related to lactoylglutathione lyase